VAALSCIMERGERVMKKRKIVRLFKGMMVAVAILFFTNIARAGAAFQPTNFITEFEYVPHEFTVDIKFY